MRWGLLGVRLAAISVYLVIAILILLSILPLIQGRISIEIPETNAAPSFQGVTLTISQPVVISNGGFFAIQDFTANLLMTNGETVVADQKTVPQEIAAGETKTIYIQFDVDTNNMSDEAKASLVFNSSQLDVSIGIHAAYTLGLVKLDVRGNQTMLHDPMISNISLDPNAITLFANGGDDILIPYSFSAGPMIQGQPLSVRAHVINESASLGNGNQDLIISENNNGQVTIAMDQEAATWLRAHSEELDFAITFDFYGATLTNIFHYSWHVEGA